MGRRARDTPRLVYDRHVLEDPPFISYAQNRADVVLWRALAHIPAGRYVEVGANHPTNDSVTRAFYDRGWSGITVDPVHELAEAHRAERQRDTMIEAVITDADPERAPGAGVADGSVAPRRLSDVVAQHGGLDQAVHFMVVDTQGSEPAVLASVDLRAFRPWVLVIAATAPNSAVQTHDAWEADLLAAGYRYCLFDGVSRFYVADEHAESLQAQLSYPACILDPFVGAQAYTASQGRQELIEDVRRWRAAALVQWAGAGAGKASTANDLQRVQRELAAVAADLLAVRSTLSWRVTRPIRALRRRGRA